MNLRPEQLRDHLARPLAPLYVLHGDAPLLVIEAADAIRAAARTQGYEEREVVVVGPNFRWDELFMLAGNLSLFGTSKLIDLRIPTGKPGREGGEALPRFAQTLGNGVCALVTLPELDWQAKKAVWYGALAAVGVVVECHSPSLAALPDWIAQRLAAQQQKAPRAALEFIAAHVEGNLLAAHQEILKLGLLHPPGELTRAQVEAAVADVARFDIGDLRDAVAAGDAARAARTLEGLRAEDAPAPLVLWALANEARQRALRPALMHAARVDRIVKGLARGDIWDEFLQLALRLTRPAARSH